MIDIPAIGFEGIHRTGKGTQIGLVRDALEKDGYTVIVIRGEGSRKGNNNSDLYFDPNSEWFNEINDRLRIKDKDGRFDIKLRRESSRRIQREIYCWLNKNHNTFQSGNSVILFDRTIISRFFLDYQADVDVDLKELMFFNQGKNGIGNRIKVFLPEIIFLFFADNDTLLSRLGDDNSDKEQTEMRKQNIISGNGIYSEMLAKLPQEVKERLFYVDGSEKIGIINSIIMEQIRGLIKKK